LKGIFAKANFPAASVVAERSKPLTGLRISTVADGTTAPVESTTLPLMEPEFPTDWAETRADIKATARTATGRHLYKVDMSPPEDDETETTK
jgi:hypothetical protein